MDKELQLFKEILEIDSTSGQERALAEFLLKRIPEDLKQYNIPIPEIEKHEVGDGTLNLLFSWGKPELVFCSHLDTVPPYIKPEFTDISAGDTLPDGKTATQNDLLITGRGSCDAKGQIFSMYLACKRLATSGSTNFGLLLLAGEETGSFGAKAYAQSKEGGKVIIVGEPTDNKQATASKGTKAYQISIKGKACHSGYPQQGVSAVERFLNFMNKLKNKKFEHDNVLGECTYNIGKLVSDNPQNILSPEVTFRLYFRTTFATDDTVQEYMKSVQNEHIKVEELGGDTPMRYLTLAGADTTVVSFGSDAPRLTNFEHKILCGPGSILTAHTPFEYVLLSELRKATEQYITFLKKFRDLKTPFLSQKR